MKRILIFSTSYRPFIGGAEVAIKEITDRIYDLEFDLITARQDKKLPTFEKLGNVNVYRLGFGFSLLDKLLLPILGATKALSLNKKNHYSMYWVVMASFAGGAAYLANIFSSSKVPIALTLQEGDSEQHLRYRWFGLIHLAWKLALARATVVTAISTYLAERAKKLGYKKEVKLIPNGVNIKDFNIPLKRLDFSFNYVHLITTSRMVEKNGIAAVIKAMLYLPTASPIKFKFVIFGAGHLKVKLERLVKKLNLTEQVMFQGYLEHETLIDYFRKQVNVLQIFVRPSLSEGMGNSFIEAMAAGLPVIATPVGGIPDFLIDKETGLFCKINNPQSIAEKVLEYVNNPELTERIIVNAKKLVTEKYDWNLIAERMEKEVFEKVISE